MSTVATATDPRADAAALGHIRANSMITSYKSVSSQSTRPL